MGDATDGRRSSAMGGVCRCVEFMVKDKALWAEVLWGDFIEVWLFY